MNVHQVVITALKNIGAPVSFLKNIDNPKPPIYVTFFEVAGIPTNHSDNKAKNRAITVQVDIWATYGNSLFILKKDIIKAMKEAGFSLTAVRADMYEVDANLVHKPLEFEILDKE